ncbi:telomere repeats-binding bouquet formation protein 1 isoform X2 [Anguilla anguilla]|uniref:telomere repeats-binding bouquet formation protein 1 isoform X2 n=1 Tax=Anguilla anguilla TaxID=7936 RepID=UPI0015A77154|nr:telomere repeats-binding bouquet formation protein 1 isoform X2 [Anguilla anguilla]
MDGSDANMLNCAIKTDLNLLLECLKYQMNCPDAQKQALLTIYSICQEKGEVIDYFRETGGVLFVYNLSKSSQHLEVKEAALFTLGGLAENSVFCQQILCRVDIFAYMMHLLVEDSPLTLKRVVVYMVSVLVANNKSGQTFAKSTGCMEVLLDLFRTSFPTSSGVADIAQRCQLWTSVSSALCGCVNNPQNEENQRMCMTIFPEARTWLEELALPRVEIMRPITSLIGMIVSNNPSAQESFASAGGLRTLARSLVRFAAESHRSPLARDLAVMATKTLSACVTDKAPLASGLAEYHLVPQLLTLLSCPGLDPRNRLCIVLALGHCTESCEEHQLQLLRAGGLPLLIQLLAESQDEELKRAATFLLHTCKRMTSTLGTDGGSRSPRVDLDDPLERAGPPGDLRSYWRSAWEIQTRIEQLEKLQGEAVLGGEGEREGVNSSDKWRGSGREETPPPASCASAGFREGTPRVRSARGRGEEGGASRQGHEGPIESRDLERTPARPRTQEPPRQDPHRNSGADGRFPRGSVRRQIFQASAAPQSRTPQQSAQSSREQLSRSTAPQPPGGASRQSEPAELGGNVRSVCSRMPLSLTPPVTGRPREREGAASPPPAPPESRAIFKRPYPAKERAARSESPSFRDHMSLCADVLEGEIRRILRTPNAATAPGSFRCSGCATGLSGLSSRTFGPILRSCRHRCDRHAVLQEAQARFRRRRRTEPGHAQQGRCAQIRLTPVRWGALSPPRSTAGPAWMTLTPVKRTQDPVDGGAYRREGPASEERQEARRGDERGCNRRERKNFTQDEVQYLRDGVKRLGPCWNSILWSYPFQKGRTNVDLAKKFSRLQEMPLVGDPED